MAHHEHHTPEQTDDVVESIVPLMPIGQATVVPVSMHATAKVRRPRRSWSRTRRPEG